MPDRQSADITIERISLKKQVSDKIREFIVSGRYKPAERIIPANIASELNIGRGVVREALFQLGNEGLVTNIPYKGSFVSMMSENDIREICSIRSLLESYSVKQLYDEITEEDYRTLDDICEEISKCGGKEQMKRFLYLDSQFHGYFVKKASVSILFRSWDVSSSKIAAIYISMHSKGLPFAESADAHRRLLAALKESPDIYYAALIEHYMRALILYK